ncbi:hypothetical protein DFJ58DRAFT_729213 [Suillus subalutaceus]|uniref:uncharacterized protein n=1 Tax=Suillus subalutaceus TaxID=48586 RepID=UPI001B85CF1C|nr:uncharacterized protein DFJ58DRAFT_729213 [Suillus subalutaceus]KAG1850634.1 hypothetical protein DFJ58DRAFT_729213 [Suillus subalutaceus]
MSGHRKSLSYLLHSAKKWRRARFIGTTSERQDSLLTFYSILDELATWDFYFVCCEVVQVAAISCKTFNDPCDGECSKFSINEGSRKLPMMFGHQGPQISTGGLAKTSLMESGGFLIDIHGALPWSSDALFEGLCDLRELFHLHEWVFGTRELFRLASLPSLQVLHFCLKPYRDIKTHSNLIPTKNFPIRAPDFDAVAPLPSFSRLTHRRLNCICPSVIDDASLKTMAQSQPQLENFGIGNAGRYPVLPSLTFVGLAYLIHHFPRLYTIDMSFWAYEVDFNNEPLPTTTLNEGILVNMSPVVDPIAVACRLHNLMPKLTYVNFFAKFDVGLPLPPPF